MSFEVKVLNLGQRKMATQIKRMKGFRHVPLICVCVCASLDSFGSKCSSLCDAAWRRRFAGKKVANMIELVDALKYVLSPAWDDPKRLITRFQGLNHVETTKFSTCSQQIPSLSTTSATVTSLPDDIPWEPLDASCGHVASVSKARGILECATLAQSYPATLWKLLQHVDECQFIMFYNEFNIFSWSLILLVTFTFTLAGFFSLDVLHSRCSKFGLLMHPSAWIVSRCFQI